MTPTRASYAARRTARTRGACRVRRCVRDTLRSGEFPLATPLPSATSAARSPRPCLALRLYYGGVRLPAPVHLRRTSVDFPERSGSSAPQDRCRASRLPCEMQPHMPGVSDRAGSSDVSRYRCRQYGLPLPVTASAPRSDRSYRCGESFSRLNTQPRRPPVNASPPPLRTTAHDSGPVWLATPSPYDTRSHNISPALAGAQLG